MKIALIAYVSKNGEVGGMDFFYDGLMKGFQKRGVNITKIDVVCDESNFDEVLISYLKCYDIDVSEYDGVISTKAPTFLVQHPNHISYLNHTIRVFYDMFDEIKNDKENYKRRKLIHHIDTLALSQPQTKRVFTIGQEVSERLKKWNAIDSEVIYQGLGKSGFYCKDYEYVFIVSRMHRWKRIDLIIESMKYVKAPVKLKIAGTGQDLDYFKKLAAGDNRIEFLGFVKEEALADLYANALVVPFVPIREDYGYIFHEAFMSKKPVITCKDSGEPARIVKDGYSGFVVSPDPIQIGNCIDKLYNDKSIARSMGENGFKSVESITWDSVVEKLYTALGGDFGV